jgi:hypothetical protein
MRFVAVVFIVLGFAILGCGKPLTDSCPNVTMTGTSPQCVVSTQCVSTNAGFKLDCTGSDGNCVCYENDLPGKTVTFQSSFCDPGASKESLLESANGACEWKL